MTVNIRKIQANDIITLVDLLHEFAEYEKLLDMFEVTEERLLTAMFGDAAFVEGLIAFDDDIPAGHALFYPSFASFRGQRGMYLEDIYVRPEYRGRGLGRSILREIARIASSRGFERIDFLVLDWNEPAIGFYRELGAMSDNATRHFKFIDEAFRSLTS